MINIWAHRGCSQKFPENTMTAFAKALEIPRLAGIELDIQMTKDGEIVVIHDERVDRTTNGIGCVKDFTYLQLRKLIIENGGKEKEKIPSIHEVLDLLQDKMKAGLFLNIELKNGNVPYGGMEDKILDLVEKSGLQEGVVYSSFYTRSLQKVRKLRPNTMLGILDARVSDCFYKRKGAFETNLNQIALHPFWKGMDLMKEQLQGVIVRAWLAGHLYPNRSTGKKLDLSVLEQKGITDVFLNEPEEYLF